MNNRTYYNLNILQPTYSGTRFLPGSRLGIGLTNEKEPVILHSNGVSPNTLGQCIDKTFGTSSLREVYLGSSPDLENALELLNLDLFLCVECMHLTGEFYQGVFANKYFCAATERPDIFWGANPTWYQARSCTKLLVPDCKCASCVVSEYLYGFMFEVLREYHGTKLKPLVYDF